MPRCAKMRQVAPSTFLFSPFLICQLKKIDLKKMENQILFTGVKVNELLEKIGQIIESKLSLASKTNEVKSQSQFISRVEVAKLLKISLPTLNDYTKSGWLTSYKIGKRVLYKYVEVLQCIDKVITNKYRKGGNHGA